ncbi:hypothetical protein ABK040_005271 [Willaertia magna]
MPTTRPSFINPPTPSESFLSSISPIATFGGNNNVNNNMNSNLHFLQDSEVMINESPIIHPSLLNSSNNRTIIHDEDDDEGTPVRRRRTRRRRNLNEDMESQSTQEEDILPSSNLNTTMIQVDDSTINNRSVTRNIAEEFNFLQNEISRISNINQNSSNLRNVIVMEEEEQLVEDEWITSMQKQVILEQDKEVIKKLSKDVFDDELLTFCENELIKNGKEKKKELSDKWKECLELNDWEYVHHKYLTSRNRF